MFLIITSHFVVLVVLSHGRVFINISSCVLQKDDGVPVHIKGGPVDKFLFGITLALCAVGTIASFHTLYVMAYPKRA
jgi:hypothetical protein